MNKGPACIYCSKYIRRGVCKKSKRMLNMPGPIVEQKIQRGYKFYFYEKIENKREKRCHAIG